MSHHASEHARLHRLVFALASLALVSAASTSAWAEPKWVRISVVHDPSTTMSVAWHTVDPDATKVEWGLDAASMTSSASGTSNLGPGNLGYIHEAEMTQLKPDTAYFYRVGDPAGGWSAPFTFRTAPAPHPDCGKVRFVYLGDNRPDSPLGGTNEWGSIFAEAVSEGPAFVLSGGDLVYDGKDDDQWESFLGWTGDPARYAPFMPSMGNHDDSSVVGDQAAYNRLFVLPRNSGSGSSGTEDYYFFTWGNAIFVSINTHLFKDGTIPFGNQALWLDEVLTNNPRRWKFVMMHHPIYTTDTLLSHPPNENSQNAALVPIFDKHHVDFVLQSHNHWYERFEPSNCVSAGKPGSETPCSVGAAAFDKGTVHLTSGGAGALQIFSCGSGLDERVKCTTDYHYVLFEIDGDKLDMQTWKTTRQIWGENSSNHEVIDQLSITKAGGGTCDFDGGVPEAGPDATSQDGAPSEGGSEAAAPDGGKADASKDGAAGKDSAPPSYPDVQPGDEPTPGSVDPGVEATSADDGGCACSSASTSNSRAGLIALALGALLTARARRRR